MEPDSTQTISSRPRKIEQSDVKAFAAIEPIAFHITQEERTKLDASVREARQSLKTKSRPKSSA